MATKRTQESDESGHTHKKKENTEQTKNKLCTSETRMSARPPISTQHETRLKNDDRTKASLEKEIRMCKDEEK